MRAHDARHFLHDRNYDAVAELAICLRIAHGNHEVVGKAHQTCAFARRQTAWPLPVALREKNLRATHKYRPFFKHSHVLKSGQRNRLFRHCAAIPA